MPLKLRIKLKELGFQTQPGKLPFSGGAEHRTDAFFTQTVRQGVSPGLGAEENNWKIEAYSFILTNLNNIIPKNIFYGFRRHNAKQPLLFISTVM